jgi:hypothetical protein
LKDEWVDVGEFDLIVTPVNSIERDINIKGLWSWVLWVDGGNLTSAEMTGNDDSITILIGESDLNVRAVVAWAGEVVSSYVDQRLLLVLGNTEGWFDGGDFWSIVENEISANVLPVLVVLIDLNGSVTSVVGWWRGANVLNV